MRTGFAWSGVREFLDSTRERLALFALWLLAASFVSITPAGLERFVPLLSQTARLPPDRGGLTPGCEPNAEPETVLETTIHPSG